MFTKAYIPYSGYYCSPFARWQGSLKNENSIELGANTAKNWFAAKNYDTSIFNYVILGMTVGQPKIFHGAPWAAALMGLKNVPGCLISQACTTSTSCVALAAQSVEVGLNKAVFCLMTDRCSNSPHTIWPDELGIGGKVVTEDWMLDNFKDPIGGFLMLQTAENVAKKVGATKEQCDEVALRRYEQYKESLKNDREFQKKYMFPVEFRKGKKEKGVLAEDEGIYETTREGLARLKPVMEGGVHSYGTQTFPADGNCGIIVADEEIARELSLDKGIRIKIVSYGFARVENGFMPMAPVPAARVAMEKAGIKVEDLKAIKTHNPFAINDIYLAKELGVDVMEINNYGSSLVYGHPQGPTTGRGIIELIEELVLKGGGYGLLTGCAAGDTAASIVLKVS